MKGDMHKIDAYEWGEVWADKRDPNAGGASHYYCVLLTEDGADPAQFASVRFQQGPRNVATSLVGALDDHILAIVEDRLRGFQDGLFPCEANSEALRHIDAARVALRTRAEERRARGVLGKNLP